MMEYCRAGGLDGTESYGWRGVTGAVCGAGGVDDGRWVLFIRYSPFMITYKCNR